MPPEGCAALRALAVEDLERGDLEEAAALLEVLVALDPADPIAWRCRATLATRRGDALAAEAARLVATHLEVCHVE